MAVSFHKRPGRGRSSAGQVRRYQPAGQDAAQVRPYGHQSGQQHRRGGTEPAPCSETRSLSNGSPPPPPAGDEERRGAPRVWLPPAKFRAEIWGVSHGHRPLRGEGEVPATTRDSGAQRSVCGADGRNGWGSEQRSSPKCLSTSDNPSVTAAPCQLPLHKGALGDGESVPFQPRLPGQRLAKRKARKEQLVKFGFCPMTPECSTGYNVRKSRQSPARAPVGITSTEQDRLEPHPAAREGASRP